MRNYLALFFLSAFLPACADEQPPAVSEENTEKTVILAEAPSDSTQKVEKTGNSESAEVPEVVTKSINNFLKQSKELSSISPTVISGLYEVVVGTEVFYVSADGRYAFLGEIRDGATGENITDRKRAELRVREVNKFDESSMVVFAPEKETKYTVNVFTDVDCGYCAKLHQGIKEMNDLGIKIRYLAFPRAGVGSKTYKTMVSVWCADDQQKAMTDAKLRKEIPAKTCDNPINEHYNLGRTIGVRGTPALLLSDGELLPGYVPPKRLINYLDDKAKKESGNTETDEVSKQ